VLALLVLLGNVLYVSWHLGFLHKPKRVLETDQFRYVEMARGRHGRQELAREPPYCWRVGVPFLASRLHGAGLSVDLSFFALTNLSLFGFLLTLWIYLAELGFALRARVTGLLTVGLTQGAVRWFEYQYWMSDPACLFLVALAFLLARRRRRLALGGISLLAALVRETYVLFYVHDLLRGLRTTTPGAAVRRTLAIAVLPLSVLVGLRLLIEPNQPDDMFASVVENVTFRARHLFDNQVYFATLGTFGVMVPLLLLFPRRLLAEARRRYDQTAYVAAVAASLIITNNTERPLAYALPVVLPAALWSLERLIAQARLWGPAVACVVVLLQLVFFARTRFAGFMGASIYQPTDAVVCVAMAAFWLACRLALRQRAAPATAGASG
jgi:hypothetical protein